MECYAYHSLSGHFYPAHEHKTVYQAKKASLMSV